ncbi:MAG: hypothetical protein AAB267_07895, partial [Candidatus Desantisbacteria bacterium]
GLNAIQNTNGTGSGLTTPVVPQGFTGTAPEPTGPGTQTQTSATPSQTAAGSIEDRAPPPQAYTATTISESDLKNTYSTILGRNDVDDSLSLINIPQSGTITNLNSLTTPASTLLGFNFNVADTPVFDAVLGGWWMPTFRYEVRFNRDANGNIIGQTTNIYEYIIGAGFVHTAREITTFIWKNNIVGGKVIGSIIDTYEIVGNLEIKTGRRVMEDVFNERGRKLYTKITYSTWVGDAANGQFIETAMQNAYKEISFTKGRYQKIENYEIIPGAAPILTSIQIIWNTKEDINKDGQKEKVNVVETWEQGILSSTQKTWKDFREVDGQNRFVTVSLIFEVAGSDIASSRTVTYKINDPQNGITTITKVY